MYLVNISPIALYNNLKLILIREQAIRNNTNVQSSLTEEEETFETRLNIESHAWVVHTRN